MLEFMQENWLVTALCLGLFGWISTLGSGFVLLGAAVWKPQRANAALLGLRGLLGMQRPSAPADTRSAVLDAVRS